MQHEMQHKPPQHIDFTAIFVGSSPTARSKAKTLENTVFPKFSRVFFNHFLKL